jgi:hypothetical protein
MPLIRTKNDVPQVYVSESRDFQIFTRVLDFVQNAMKYDIDSILNSISTYDISDEYIEHLIHKVGFFTDKDYDNYSLRKVLTAIPHIIRNKGSEYGISMCINTFLNIAGYRKSYTVSLYNDDDVHPYTVRIGIEGDEINTDILKDMLSYVVPCGYFIEFYFYTSVSVPDVNFNFDSHPYILKDTDYKIISTLRKDEDLDTMVETSQDMNRSAYNTVQLTTVYDPSTNEGEN